MIREKLELFRLIYRKMYIYLHKNPITAISLLANCCRSSLGCRVVLHRASFPADSAWTCAWRPAPLCTARWKPRPPGRRGRRRRPRWTCTQSPWPGFRPRRGSPGAGAPYPLCWHKVGRVYRTEDRIWHGVYSWNSCDLLSSRPAIGHRPTERAQLHWGIRLQPGIMRY